jgi:quinolinate synthase
MWLAGQGRSGEAEPLLAEVAVEPEIADRARLAIERMMAIG